MFLDFRTTRSWLERTGTALAAAALLVASPVVAAAQTSAAPPSSTVAAALAPALAAALPSSAAAAVAPTFDTQMIQLVNSARASAGVGKVTEARGLSQLSVWWSTQLQNGATGYNLAHNPNAWVMVTNFGASNRTAWAENVGWSSSTGTTAAQLFNAYMHSPGHRANIMSARYHYIGMGTVGGAHGLFSTTEFTDTVQSGQAVGPAPSVTYQFVLDTSTHAVYRMVGGAPVYVSSFAPFAGRKVVKSMTHAQILAMPRFPANGTFVRTLGNGSIYRFAGGAPVYVSSLGLFGGVHGWVDIDPAAVANAGGSGYWSHLLATPADGTFVRSPDSGAIYRMAGGAPLYVASWGPLGGPKPWVDIDPAAIANGGKGGGWAHLKMYPATDTYIKGAGSDPIYRVVNGVAIHLIAWSQVGGPKPFSVVHPYAISRAGTGGFYNHLKK